MLFRPTFIVLSLMSYICLSNAAPALKLEDEILDDTAIVESTVREVRAVKDSEAAPAKWEKVYGTGDKGDIGYTRQKSDKGKTGYQKFDSFHKKGGDSYGYEKHDSYGHDKKGGKGGKTSHAETSHEEDENKSDEVASPDESSSYEVIEDSEGDYDEDSGSLDGGESVGYYEGEQASEEDGGIDKSGYDDEDAANYDNPTHYSYGSGSDYDFKK